MKAFSPSFSQFAAAMIAVFALSSCTKERAEDLAPLGGNVEAPAAHQEKPMHDAHDVLDMPGGADAAFQSEADAQRLGQDPHGQAAFALISPAREGKGGLESGQHIGREESGQQAAGQSHIGREEFAKRGEIVPANSGLSSQSHIGREEFAKRGEVVAAQGGQGQQFGQGAK